MDSRTVATAGVFCIAATSVGAGYFFGQNVPMAVQADLFGLLNTTASIVFALIGAWLAIVYPERLRLGLRPGMAATQSHGGDNVALLLRPARHSTFLIAILLIIGVSVPLLKQLPWAIEHALMLRGVSYALLITLTWWEIGIIFSTLFSTDLMERSAKAEDLQRLLSKRFNS